MDGAEARVSFDQTPSGSVEIVSVTETQMKGRVNLSQGENSIKGGFHAELK